MDKTQRAYEDAQGGSIWNLSVPTHTHTALRQLCVAMLCTVMGLYKICQPFSGRYKKILFVIVCLAGVLTITESQGQTLPKYAYYNFFSEGKSLATSIPFFAKSESYKFQTIYPPYQLPNLPAGPLHSVYFRVGVFSGNPSHIFAYDSMWMKMGLLPIQDSTYSDTMVSGSLHYLFKTGLTLVFSQRNYQVIGADSIGTWIRFPLSAGFSYNPSMNLVVELGRGNNNKDSGIGILEHYSSTVFKKNILLGYGKEYDLVSFTSLSGQVDIGFDDAPTAVGGLVNLKGFYAFPNPSQGLFTVGFEPWGGQASTVHVSVTDMVGRQVWQHSYQGVQASLFTANVDLRSQPKGIYLLRVQADAAQALKRVVLE